MKDRFVKSHVPVDLDIQRGLGNPAMMAVMDPREQASAQVLGGHAQLSLAGGVRWFSCIAPPREFGSLSDLGRQLDVEGILDRRAI
jgi:hypothetical protein